MSGRGVAVIAGLVATFLWIAPQSVGATSLVNQLDGLFGQSGITLDVQPINPAFPPHTAHFSSASLQQLGFLTSTLAAEASDFPAISTAPGFTYRYNEKLQVFEPVRGNFGPIFVERPETLGQGRFDFGLSYAYVNFTKLNGTDLDNLDFTLHHNDCCGGPNTPDFPEFEEDSIGVKFNKFQLSSNVITLSGTYGLAPNFDVNLLLPIVYTDMDVRAVATINNTTEPPVHFFDNATRTITEQRSVSDNHLGVGDLQLRTKYYFGSLSGFGTAAGLTFRFPSGSQDNFQGFGEFTLEPFFVTARDLGPLNLHASTGFQIDPQTTDRTRVRYGGGMALQVAERVAIVTDVVGNSNITSQEESITVPTFDQQGNTIGSATVTQQIHADIVDVVPGIKVNVAGSVFAFFSAFVPINDSGLRASFIPTGGVEMSF
jgi:hypothetical protein